MQNILNKIETLSLKLFYIISKLALILIGFIVAFLLFRELANLLNLTMSTLYPTVYYDILKSILTFFLFFEFLALIIVSIKNNGHVSLSFLFALAITALVRSLLTYHDNVLEILFISLSILILLVGTLIHNRYDHSGFENLK